MIKKENKINTTLFCIFVFCMFLRLFKLGSIPYAIHIDEAGLLYNVQSLLKYGTDQTGNSWPLLLANYHSEQSAMYTYLAVLSCRLFGESLFSLRLPAVLNMALVFIFGNKIVRKLYNNTKINIIFSVLLTVCPYFVLSSRMALDCNLMLGFSTVFLYLFVKAIDSGNIKDAIVAGIICGLTLYTYVLSYIALPIFLCVMLIYLLKIKKVTLKQIVAFAIPVFTLAAPLIIVQIVNVFELNEFVIFGITFPNFESPRHGDIGLLSIFTNLLTPILYLLFTPQRLYECIFIYGNFQWVLAPFLIIGIFVNMKDMIKQKTILWKNILIIFWIAVYLTTTVVHKDMTTWHLNSLMFISLIFIFDGLKVCVLKIQNKNLQLVFVLLVIAMFVITTCSFLFYYYAGDYANDEANSYYVYEDIVPVLEEVDKIKTENQNVYILIPSMTYRIKEKIPYFEPKSQYEKAKELPIMIDNYTFDMGAVSLQNPDPSAIYVVIDCYEAYKEVLIPLNMETITVGNYIIYVGGKTT